MTVSRLAVWLFGAMLIAVPVRGDDSSMPDTPLYEFATDAQVKGGQLHVYPWEYSKTWLNGIRRDDDDDLVLKPGDVVDSFVCGDFTRVRQYRLDSLTPNHAVFTLWYFAVVRTEVGKNSVRYQKGGQVSVKTFTLDLTKSYGLLVDYGPNNVELGAVLPTRSKPLR